MKKSIVCVNVLIVLICLCIVVSIPACVSSSQDKTTDDAINIEIEKTDIQTDPQLPDEVNQDNEIKSEVPVENASINDESLHFSSIGEMFRKTDENYSDSESYQKVLKAYEDRIGKSTENRIKEATGGAGNLKLWYGYVDYDDIPEIFASIGTFHISGIHVFTYLSDEDRVVWLGEFSSFGGLNYIDHKNRLISQYGAQGCYMYMYSEIIHGKADLVGSVMYDGIREVEHYYARYPIPEGVDGSHKDGYGSLTDGVGPNAKHVDFPYDEIEYIVSNEEYESICDILEKHPEEGEYKSVGYDSKMAEVDLKEGGLDLGIR